MLAIWPITSCYVITSNSCDVVLSYVMLSLIPLKTLYQTRNGAKLSSMLSS